VRRRLGVPGLAVLDARLVGGKMQSLVVLPSLGCPSSNTVNKVVRDIKSLAKEFAISVGDSELLHKIQQAMAAAVAKRKQTLKARQAAVARGVFAPPMEPSSRFLAWKSSVVTKETPLPDAG